MNKSKKQEQLGMPIGTASARLKKSIMFDLIRKLELDTCFVCNSKITNVDDLSVEHKKPWLDSTEPKKLFFDLENIAFSHLKCNIKNVARRGPPRSSHSYALYKFHGCRCNVCRGYNNARRQKQRARKKQE